MTRSELRAAVEARLDEMRGALEKIDDEAALDVMTLFESWEADQPYTAGQRIKYMDKLYRVVQSHTAQVGWEPPSVPALFTEIAKPGEIPDWKQPTGAQDAYEAGDKVRHIGSVWMSNVNNNVWEPGVYGWSVIE